MAEIAGLGLACNVMQIISFSSEVIQLCVAIHNGTQTSFDQLQDTAKALGNASEQVLGWPQLKSGASPLSACDTELVDIAKKCRQVAASLRNEAQSIREKSTGGWASSMCGAARAIWKKRKLESLKDELAQCERTMATHLALNHR